MDDRRVIAVGSGDQHFKHPTGPVGSQKEQQTALDTNSGQSLPCNVSHVFVRDSVPSGTRDDSHSRDNSSCHRWRSHKSSLSHR